MQKQYSKFLDCVGDNFFIQMIEWPNRREALLVLLITNREELVENVKMEANLGDTKIIELDPKGRKEREQQNEDIDLQKSKLMELVGTIPYEASLRYKVIQER